MAHGKGSTGYSSDVLEAGQMAASLWKVPATASIMTTSRGAKDNEGKDETQSLYLKQGGMERRNRWRRVIGAGPPLYPEGDGSLCTGVVLPRTTRER